MALKRSEALGTAGRFAFHDRGDRDDSGALVTSAINRSLLAGAAPATGRPTAMTGILVTESRRGRRRALAIVFRDEPEIIGCDGGPGSDDEDPVVDGDDDELAEPSEVLTAEERAFLNLTKRNTDFNSITSNLSGTSRTLLDWVDENDRTTERSALTGRHKKFTPVVCVAPFSTGRGPGPLKINPVAPMQNGEVVSTGRIQEMVEKRSVIDQATKREQQVTRLDDKVTRLDDKVTRLDDKVDKITRLDDKDAKITRLDDTIEKPDEKVTKVDDKITKIDDKSIENYEKLKSSEINAADDKPVANKSNSPPAKIKAVSATRTADVKSTTDTGSQSVSEGISQLKAGPGSRVPDTGNAEPAKSAQRWSGGADRSGSAAVESGGGGEQPAPADPPMSNIDLIKARLAEKAAQNGPSSWRRPGNHPERNRARLNSLDGVPKSPKLRSHRAPGEGGSAVGGASDTGRTRSPPTATEPPSAAESRTAACDRVTEPPTPAAASSDAHKNGPAAERQHLSDGDRSTSETPDTTGDEEKLASTGVKLAPADHKPPIVNDKPKLAAKPGKVKPLGQPAGWDGGARRSSREVGVAQPTPASPKAAESRAKTDSADELRSAVDADKEKPTVNLSERPTGPDKPHSGLVKGQNENVMSHDKAADDSNQESSYSPKMPVHKTEVKSNVVETKTQRAMKREKELERQREELEKKNRVEKKAPISSDSVRPEPRLPETPQVPESSVTRRGSPPSVEVPPSLRNSHGSGLYAQIQQADQRRASRDAGPPPRPSPPSEPRSEPVQAEPATSQTPSVSTDDEEDELPAPPQRTVSVSPRSRRKRGGVSFAPGTEDSRPGGAKPRSQSMPRPGALDQRLGRDEGLRGRLTGGGGVAEERRSRRDEPRSRARFSLKKFLKFGRDEKRKERDLVYGEFRAKPEIIHPIDRAGVGCVQVIGRPSEQRRREQAEYRQRRERPSQDTATTQDTSPTTVNPPSTPPRLPERQSHPAHPTHPTHPTHHGQHSHGGHRASTGLTPEGRPKPPPPPPPSCRQSGDPMTPPTRPPPPNPHLFSRSRDGWARAPDSDYANLGVSRAGLTPKKPGRGSRSRERSEGSASADHQPPALQADQVGLRRQQPCRLSLREAPACGPPASLLDSYDAVTAANREALQQLCEKMSGAVPAPLLPLQAAPLSLRDFQVSPQSQLPLGRHLFVEAVCGGEPVALCLTEGPMAAAPLSVPSVTDFTDTVPARLLADPHGPDGSQRIGTVHVIPAARVRPLSALLDAQPAEAPHSATLLLLQTVRQLQLLPAVDEQLSQLVALTVDRLQPPRLAAVLSAPPPPPGAGLSPCVAALSVLLRLLGVPAAVQRARDGRGVSSVPDGPQVTEHELLASLLQRDDDASLRRAAAVLGCLLWAPAGLAPAEAPRWLHRQRAELLGAAVRWDQPPAVDQLLRLCFLAETDPETVTDALELINI
ncbi:actin cytoskeleton-regulatory complex protein pan1-like [Amphibalanus amphitrite]|uniref:actin cytoskeleton-regulatory complex protein pan1-like n=1 Tax=Amphibalanus amphitrite TaxID=1232801 RepID=UPI001C90B0A9|nr:actin cytoskeleton-regulatory complex protein pan1-like [Amphibalanus amphitrite]